MATTARGLRSDILSSVDDGILEDSARSSLLLSLNKIVKQRQTVNYNTAMEMGRQLSNSFKMEQAENLSKGSCHLLKRI